MAKRKGGKQKRKKTKSWSQRRFSFRIFLRDYSMILSTILVILCILFIVFGALGLFFYDTNSADIPQPVRDWIAFLHGANKPNDPHYDLCLFPVGLLVILVAGWYMGDGIVKRRRFNVLMDIESKFEFIDNLDEIEELAWKIGTKYEILVMDRKEEFGLNKKKR